MGRKIPAKKHRGVKDPIEQQARRFQSIRGIINAPPKDPDEQPIPRSLSKLFAFQNKNISRVKKKKKKETSALSHPGSVTGEYSNPIGRLKQLPGESGRGFTLRINSAIRALHDPTEQDYPQDIEAEDVKGEQMAAQRARRQRKLKKVARASASDSALPTREKLTRGQKLTRKKEAKKLKALQEEGRPEVVYERVAFGDVVHAPPALPTPRRAAQPSGAPRPGRRDLLLTSMLPSSCKSRELPPAELLRRERARLDVVAAYRQLKRQRQAEQRNDSKKKNTRNECMSQLGELHLNSFRKDSPPAQPPAFRNCRNRGRGGHGEKRSLAPRAPQR